MSIMTIPTDNPAHATKYRFNVAFDNGLVIAGFGHSKYGLNVYILWDEIGIWNVNDSGIHYIRDNIGLPYLIKNGLIEEDEGLFYPTKKLEPYL